MKTINVFINHMPSNTPKYMFEDTFIYVASTKHRYNA